MNPHSPCLLAIALGAITLAAGLASVQNPSSPTVQNADRARRKTAERGLDDARPVQRDSFP
jgi:hypothetical protein